MAQGRGARGVSLAVVVALCGCGPAGYLSVVTRDANHAVQEAKAAGAPRLSPYEWTSAILYLERSHELAGYARWQDSLAFGRRAAAMARAATDHARRASNKP